MTDFRGYRGGPLPHPDFRRLVADEVLPPFQDFISGEVSGSGRVNKTLGVCRFAGRIKDVFFSCFKAGKHDSNVPMIWADVEINGVSVLSTQASIVHVSGEVNQRKTSFPEAADTGITQAVVDTDANSFAVGDIITWTCRYSGEGTPTNKIQSPGVIVEIEPLG